MNANGRNDEPMLTLEQVADRLGTGVRFARRLVSERRITYVRVGRSPRVPVSALREYIAIATVEATFKPQALQGFPAGPGSASAWMGPVRGEER